MAEKFKPVVLTAEEAAKIDPAKIGKGTPAGNGEVQAQAFIVTCGGCGFNYVIAQRYQFTVCPNCGRITQWW